MLRSSDGRLYYRVGAIPYASCADAKDGSPNPAGAALAASLEGDERIVYQCIRGADNKGIWTRDLKNKTGLHQTVITKALRVLENRRLIKAVRSVKHATRKVYMLFHLEPSTSITGGPWFNENELDTEFIDVLCKSCYRIVLKLSGQEQQMASLDSSNTAGIIALRHLHFPTLSEISKVLLSSGVMSAGVVLTEEDVQMVLERLVFDGVLERFIPPRSVVQQQQQQQQHSSTTVSNQLVDDDDYDEMNAESLYVYRATRSSLDWSRIGAAPCGTCPVQHCCGDRGPVTPAKCAYFTQWLSF